MVFRGELALFRMSPSELRRFMKRMGIKVDVEEIDDADRVIIERSGSKNLVIDNPTVTIMRMKGQSIIYVMGEIREVEKTIEKREEIPEEDVQLVASEAGVSLEEAREALEATGGDIAQAIMLLESRRKT